MIRYVETPHSVRPGRSSIILEFRTDHTEASSILNLRSINFRAWNIQSTHYLPPTWTIPGDNRPNVPARAMLWRMDTEQIAILPLWRSCLLSFLCL